MKLPFRLASLTVLTILALAVGTSSGQEGGSSRPGTEESAAVDQANVELEVVYKRLMNKLDDAGKKALKEAQRSWIKWRDDEAQLIARVNGAIGGSALRVDFLNAQKQLIDQRTDLLNDYLKTAANN